MERKEGERGGDWVTGRERRGLDGRVRGSMGSGMVSDVSSQNRSDSKSDWVGRL